MCHPAVRLQLPSFSLLSFSVSAFDSLIIVGTNNISEKSLTEINLKVRPKWAWPVDVQSSGVAVI